MSNGDGLAKYAVFSFSSRSRGRGREREREREREKTVGYVVH